MLFPSLLLVLSTLSYQVASHGYLSSPPPRGIQKTDYQIDDLKSPNSKGLCRGEPEGPVTNVKPGQTLKLGLTITAPHIGPCRVTLLDVDLSNESKPFDEKFNCAAPGGPGFWNVKLPSNASGRKVLRWYWEGQHIGTPGEPYEQCIDLNFGGGSGGGGGGGDGGDNYVGGSDSEVEEEEPRYTPPPKEKQRKQRKPKKTKKPKKQHSKPRPSYDDDQSNDYGADMPPNNNYDGEESHSGGKCEHGAYKCKSDGMYAVCNWGLWVNMSCGAGTVCKPSGNSIVCGYP